MTPAASNIVPTIGYTIKVHFEVCVEPCRLRVKTLTATTMLNKTVVAIIKIFMSNALLLGGAQCFRCHFNDLPVAVTQ